MDKHVKFIWEVVGAYKSVLASAGVFSLVSLLLRDLEREGEVASVQRPEDDKYWNKACLVLESISLSEHIRTCLEIFLEEGATEEFLPYGVLMILAHDIGKLPSVRSKFPRFKRHEVLSKHYLKVLAEELGGVQAEGFENVLFAVRFHHSVKDLSDGVKFLKRVNYLARRRECRLRGSYLSYKDFPKALLKFLLLEFLRDIRSYPFAFYLAKQRVAIIEVETLLKFFGEVLLKHGLFYEDLLQGKVSGILKVHYIMDDAYLARALIKIHSIKKEQLVFVIPLSEEEAQPFSFRSAEKQGIQVSLEFL